MLLQILADLELDVQQVNGGGKSNFGKQDIDGMVDSLLRKWWMVETSGWMLVRRLPTVKTFEPFSVLFFDFVI